VDLARGFQLPDSAALPILQAFASQCEPPVEHAECPHFLEQARKYGTEPTGGRVREPLPTIEVTTDEKAVADQAVDALVRAGGLFHRGQRLVHIVTEGRPKSILQRPEGAPHIAAVHVHHLRELIAAAAKFFKLVPQKSGDKIVYDTVPLNGPVASGPARCRKQSLHRCQLGLAFQLRQLPKFPRSGSSTHKPVPSLLRACGGRVVSVMFR